MLLNNQKSQSVNKTEKKSIQLALMLNKQMDRGWKTAMLL